MEPIAGTLLLVSIVQFIAALANAGFAAPHIIGSSLATHAILAPTTLIVLSAICCHIAAKHQVFAEGRDIITAMQTRARLCSMGVPIYKQKSLDGHVVLYPDFSYTGPKILKKRCRLLLTAIGFIGVGVPALCMVVLIYAVAITATDPVLAPTITATAIDFALSLLPWIIILVAKRYLPSNVLIREQAELWWRKNRTTAKYKPTSAVITAPIEMKKEAPRGTNLSRRSDNRPPRSERTSVSRCGGTININIKKHNRTA